MMASSSTIAACMMPATGGMVARIISNSFSSDSPIGDVARIGDNLDAARDEIARPRPCASGVRRAAAAEQHQMARAAIDQPFRGLEAEAAEGAGDDVRAFGAASVNGLRTSRARAVGLRRPHHDLADVARLLHQVEGFRTPLPPSNTLYGSGVNTPFSNCRMISLKMRSPERLARADHAGRRRRRNS